MIGGAPRKFICSVRCTTLSLRTSVLRGSRSIRIQPGGLVELLRRSLHEIRNNMEEKTSALNAKKCLKAKAKTTMAKVIANAVDQHVKNTPRGS